LGARTKLRKPTKRIKKMAQKTAEADLTQKTPHKQNLWLEQCRVTVFNC